VTGRRLLRPEEAAALLAVSRSKVYELMRSGRLGAIKIDGSPPRPGRGRRGLHRASRGGGGMTASRKRWSKGDGGVFQQANGRWVPELDLGWIEGKRRRRRVYGATERDVRPS